MSARILRPGREIAPAYEVIAHLSRGRTLDVYDVWSHERSARAVAKTLRPDRRRDTAVRRQLMLEGRLLRRLAHPHIVRAYDVVLEPHPVVVLETLTGATLSHLIHRRRTRLPARDIAVLGLQLASAVEYLHAHGYLHLDLKPSNVVAEAGRAKLIDLSVARRPGRGKPGVGTWCYLAPEQAVGGLLGPAADVWGLGAVLFEAATAAAPFDDGDDGREYPQVVRRAEPVRTLTRLPAPLADAIDAALEPDSAARPSLSELGEALERVPGAGDRRAVRPTRDGSS